MLVLLASYPRSGNTLVRQVLESAFGVPTYTVYRNENSHGIRNPMFYEAPIGSLSFVKTHEIDSDVTDNDFPAIHIVRDGRDTLVSHAHFQIAFADQRGQSVPSVLRGLIEGKGRWNWSEHFDRWSQRDATQATIRFEDLILDPIGCVRSACQTVGVEWTAVSVPLPSFRALHHKSPEFFRSGKVGQWPLWFNDELHERFWELHGNTMDQLGYRRECESHRLLAAEV
jgi:hypothetical protein